MNSRKEVEDAVSWMFDVSPDRAQELVNQAGHIDMLGKYAKHVRTGVAGQVVAVTASLMERPQYRLARFGVDTYGNPYPELLFYIGECVPVTHEAAGGRD